VADSKSVDRSAGRRCAVGYDTPYYYLTSNAAPISVSRLEYAKLRYIYTSVTACIRWRFAWRAEASAGTNSGRQAAGRLFSSGSPLSTLAERRTKSRSGDRIVYI